MSGTTRPQTEWEAVERRWNTSLTALSGLRDLGARVIRWRVGWIWYAVAIGLPLAVHVLTVALNVGFGAGAPSVAQFSPLSGIIVVFALRLVSPLDVPVGEEPGWRGFALPRLQADHSPLLATLILGVLVAIWHAPSSCHSTVSARSIS